MLARVLQSVFGSGFAARVSTIVVAASLAIACLIPGVAPASRWSVQRTRNGRGITTNWLQAVACPSRSDCFAVGYTQPDVAGSSHGALIEHWDATKWSAQTFPSVPDLTGVACTSNVACTAVGDAAAFRWNGRSWSLQSSRHVIGVSCPALRLCTAVGNSRPGDDGGLPTAARWNGLSWFTQSTPSVGHTMSAGLNGVSCPSKRVCLAVGTNAIQDGFIYRVLAERWNGTKWSVQPTPGAAGNFAGLSSVSCASPTVCEAVGSRARGLLAEGWNGTKWSIQHTPNPYRGGNLTGVSCPSENACMAVGTDQFADTKHLIAARWNGRVWSLQPVPDWSNAFLSGISCPSPAICTAVGRLGNRTLGMRWNRT